MSHTDMYKTIQMVARSPVGFRRDTVLLLNSLDRIEEINRNLQNEFNAAIEVVKKESDK